MSSPDGLLAKGLRDDQTKGESLVAHTLEVVQRVARLRDRAPYLSELAEDPRFWHRLGLAAAMHDLGKADPRFQKMLKEDKPTPGQKSSYGQRHEVVSLAWLNWILGDDPHQDRLWLSAVIGSHHRDHTLIKTRYSLGTAWEPESSVRDLIDPIPAKTFSDIANLFLEQILPQIRNYQLLDEHWQPPGPWIPADRDHDLAEQSIRDSLRAWGSWMQTGRDPKTCQLGILARGTILLADHAGSAHAEFRSIPLLQQPVAVKERLAPPSGYSYYPHQNESSEKSGHAILVAPTGSGKTEAALRWAAQQYAENPGHPPLFYVLPFKASMNAMQRRLAEKLTTGDKEEQLVALQHSSALQVLYHQMMEEPNKPQPHQAAWAAKRQQNLAKLHTTPIRVLSPYQILRAAYQLKGHEAIWTDAAGGLFIFDEIHAYEVDRLARILEMLRFLVDRLHAKVFVMTATMPKPIMDRVSEILDVKEPIKATDETYAKFRRHRLKLSEAGLLEDATIAQIVARIQNGEAVLCVATTVKRAQELQTKLRDALPAETYVVKLLHSRFNGEDRNNLETEVRNSVATDRTKGSRNPITLVATQVVEVSLDVDFDVLFTDPAPIEALLQRFGRVNRSRRENPHDVIVCTNIDDAFPVYDKAIVIAAIKALRTADNQVIDESLVQTWIDEVYSGQIGIDMMRGLEYHGQEFREKVLAIMTPFDSQKDLEDMFYRQFDGTEVIPRCLVDRYKELLESEPLKASSLTVPISYNQLNYLKRERRLIPPVAVGLPEKSPDVADVPYSQTSGLDLTLNREDENT